MSNRTYHSAPHNAPEGKTHLVVYAPRQDEDDSPGSQRVSASFKTIAEIERDFDVYPHIAESATVYELVQVVVQKHTTKVTKTTYKVGK